MGRDAETSQAFRGVSDPVHRSLPPRGLPARQTQDRATPVHSHAGRCNHESAQAGRDRAHSRRARLDGRTDCRVLSRTRAGGNRPHVRRKRAAQGAALRAGDAAPDGRGRFRAGDRRAGRRARRPIRALQRRYLRREVRRHLRAIARPPGSCQPGAVRLRRRGGRAGPHRLRGDRHNRRAHCRQPCRRRRLRLRPRILLPAVRLHPGRGRGGAQGGGEPPREGLPQAGRVHQGAGARNPWARR